MIEIIFDNHIFILGGFQIEELKINYGNQELNSVQFVFL